MIEQERLRAINVMAYSCRQIRDALVDITNIQAQWPKFMAEHYSFLPCFYEDNNDPNYRLGEWAVAVTRAEANMLSREVLFGEDPPLTWKGPGGEEFNFVDYDSESIVAMYFTNVHDAGYRAYDISTGEDGKPKNRLIGSFHTLTALRKMYPNAQEAEDLPA